MVSRAQELGVLSAMSSWMREATLGQLTTAPTISSAVAGPVVRLAIWSCGQRG